MSIRSSSQDTFICKRSPAKSTYSELSEINGALVFNMNEQEITNSNLNISSKLGFSATNSIAIDQHIEAVGKILPQQEIRTEDGSSSSLAILQETARNPGEQMITERKDKVSQPAAKQPIDTFFVSKELELIKLKTLGKLMKDPSIIGGYNYLKLETSLKWMKRSFSVEKRTLLDEWTSDDTKNLEDDIKKSNEEAGLRTTEMLRNSYMLFMTHITHLSDSVTSADKKKSEQSNTEIDQNKSPQHIAIQKYFGFDLDDNTNTDFAETIKEKERITFKKLKDLIKNLGAQKQERVANLDNLDSLLEKFDNYLDISYLLDIERKFEVVKRAYEKRMQKAAKKSNNRLQTGDEKSNEGKTIRPRNPIRAENTKTEVKKIIEKLRNLIEEEKKENPKPK